MKQKNNKILLLLLLILCVLIVGCTNKNNKPDDNDNDNIIKNIEGDATSAFKQFGIDLEEVKPNLGVENTAYTKTGNYTIKDDTPIYFRKATYIEDLSNLTVEQRNSYQSKIFDYTKYISDTNKIYYCSGCLNSDEVKLTLDNSISDKGDYHWSYQYDGMIVEVNIIGVMEGNQIGLVVTLGEQ